MFGGPFYNKIIIPKIEYDRLIQVVYRNSQIYFVDDEGNILIIKIDCTNILQLIRDRNIILAACNKSHLYLIFEDGG